MHSLRTLILLIYFIAIVTESVGQIFGNYRPRIISQRDLSTNEEQPITIQLTDLVVVDIDNDYPEDFTLNVQTGNNYTVSGSTVTPDLNFSGNLTVPITVNDGEEDSRRYNLRIRVENINDPPLITGQKPVNAEEDQSVRIQLAHLEVEDPDDNFPKGFELEILPGNDYTVSGDLVSPEKNLNGVLQVNVRVKDGDAESNLYALQINIAPVNDPPVITGQEIVTMDENSPLTIELSHLKVSDPDNDFPNDFTLKVSGGSHYSVSGNTITPDEDFFGKLSVGVTVNDGQHNSNVFPLNVEVLEVKDVPVITGQVSIRIQEDKSVTIQLSHLIVEDHDSHYPEGFSLKIQEGANYTINNTTITPLSNFYGVLKVGVTVNDGENTSEVYTLTITVDPVNDAPEIINLEPDPLIVETGRGPIPISRTCEIVDVDNDSLLLAEVGFDTEMNYRKGYDELLFISSENIRGAFDTNSGTLFLIGKAPVNEYQQAIRSIEYNFRNEENDDQPEITNEEIKRLFIRLSDGENGDMTYDERQLVLKPVSIPLEIPSGFTPNGDFANDTWVIRPINDSERFDDAVIRVYNVRGKLVYQATGLDNEWDGRLNGMDLPVDTYYYTIDLNLSFTKATYKGAVTILR